jgi:hypothetical protein
MDHRTSPRLTLADHLAALLHRLHIRRTPCECHWHEPCLQHGTAQAVSVQLSLVYARDQQGLSPESFATSFREQLLERFPEYDRIWVANTAT